MSKDSLMPWSKFLIYIKPLTIHNAFPLNICVIFLIEALSIKKNLFLSLH